MKQKLVSLLLLVVLIPLKLHSNDLKLSLCMCVHTRDSAEMLFIAIQHR